MRITSPAFSGALSRVASSATDVTILAANDARKGALVYNESTAVLYLALSIVTSDATHYSVQVPASGSFILGDGDYIGVIKGFWASANGSAVVTEFA